MAGLACPVRCRFGYLIGVIPIAIISRILGMVDILFIFGKEKRCIHDIIAGTKVVNV
jgi:uncharacterized RDD family membrane protein YckC